MAAISPNCTAGSALVAAFFLLYGLIHHVTFVDGLTLQMKQPAPMAASLYKAPQSYDQSKERLQRLNPYIIIPKVRLPCYWASQHMLQGLGRGPQAHRNKVTVAQEREPARVALSSLNDNQFVSSTTPWSDVDVHDPVQGSDFPGSWMINKPQLENNKDWPINQLVTYNEDGTRVLPESLYNNMHAIRPLSTQNPMEYFHNITSADSMETIIKPEVTSSSLITPPPPSPSLLSISLPSSESAIASTTIEVDKTWADDTANTRDEFYSVTTIASTTFETSTIRLPTIMDKLGGGAKRILAQILGGILHGRQTQKNLDVKEGINSDQLTAHSAAQGLTPMSYSGLVLAPEPSMSTSADDADLLASGDHPMKVTVTESAFEKLHSNDDQTGSHRSSANTGWRPVIPWPPIWLKTDSQSGPRPAAPPATLLHYWSSTKWNDTTNNVNRSHVESVRQRPSASRESVLRTILTPLCLTNITYDTSHAASVTFNRSITATTSHSPLTLIDFGESNNTGASKVKLNITEDQLDINENVEATVSVADAGGPQMRNSSDLDHADGRRCISIREIINALIRVYKTFPLGIPKPLDILFSYGLRHHWNESTDSDRIPCRLIQFGRSSPIDVFQ